MFNPNVGDYVVVCYDGKLYRQTTGKVIEKQSDNKINVKFIRWADMKDESVNNWFERTGNDGFGSIFKDSESLGAIAYGEEGDWYSVFDIKYKGLNGFENPIKDFFETKVQ